MSESGDLGSNGGLPFDQAAKQELFDQLDKSYTSGITFSGGDPLYPGNRMEVTGAGEGDPGKNIPRKRSGSTTGSRWETVKGY